MKLNRKQKGSLIIEGMVGVFFIAITSLVMVSAFSYYNKTVKRVNERENLKEIQALIIKEIKYNTTYCEALSLFKEEKRYRRDMDYYIEKIKNNEGFLVGGEVTGDDPLHFKVKIERVEGSRLYFKVESYGMEEVVFYKYQIY